jgi:hypothetical protein
MRNEVPSSRTLTRVIIISWRFFAHFHSGKISLFVISSTSLVINVLHSRPTCALRTSEISSFANKNARYLRSLARNSRRASNLPLPLIASSPSLFRTELSRVITLDRSGATGPYWLLVRHPISGNEPENMRLRGKPSTWTRIRKVPFTKDAPCESHNGKRIPRWYHRGMYDVSATPLDFRFSFRSAINGTRKNRQYPTKFPTSRNRTSRFLSIPSSVLIISQKSQ